MANYNFADAKSNKLASTWMLFRKLLICWGIFALIPVCLVFVDIAWWSHARDSSKWFPFDSSEKIRYLCKGEYGCGPDGKNIRSGCLVLVDEKETQFRAHNKCMERGLGLATVESAAENREIDALYRKDSPFWFGLYKPYKQYDDWYLTANNAPIGSHKLHNKVEKMVYSNWHDGVDTDDYIANGAVWGIHNWAEWILLVLRVYFGVSLCVVILIICISFGLYFMASDGLMAKQKNKIRRVMIVDGLCVCLAIPGFIVAVRELAVQETVASGLYVGWVVIQICLLFVVIYFGIQMRAVFMFL